MVEVPYADVFLGLGLRAQATDHLGFLASLGRHPSVWHPWDAQKFQPPQ